MTTPSVGQIVHYVHEGGGQLPTCCAAIVTAVLVDPIDPAERVVDLSVFIRAGGVAARYSVRESHPGDPFTWHWPELVNDGNSG